jgi:hypothetical protein
VSVAHRSDCAKHSEPAYPAGPCSCGVEIWLPVSDWTAAKPDDLVELRREDVAVRGRREIITLHDVANEFAFGLCLKGIPSPVAGSFPGYYMEKDGWTLFMPVEVAA